MAKRINPSRIALDFSVIFGLSEQDEIHKQFDDIVIHNALALKEKWHVRNDFRQNLLFHEIQDADQYMDVFWTVAKGLNQAIESHVTYHDGYNDPDKEFHGHHWHIILRSYSHPTRDLTWGRQLLALFKGWPKCYLRVQTAAHLHRLLHHNLTAPRQLIGVVGDTYSSLMDKTLPDGHLQSSPLQDDWSSNIKAARIDKPPPAVFKIRLLNSLMLKYNSTDITTIKRTCRRNKQDYKVLETLISSSNFNELYAKSVDQFKLDETNITFQERLQRYISDIENTLEGETPTNLSLEESIRIYEQWCLYQRDYGATMRSTIPGLNEITPMTIAMAVFVVLTKRHDKINCIWMQGESNAGKTYIVDSLLDAFYPNVGQTLAGSKDAYRFQWAGCLDVPVIKAHEFRVTEDNVDHLKLIMEGKQALVDRKGKQPQILHRTPIVLTTQGNPFKWISTQDRDAIYNRMISIENLKKIGTIKDNMKPLSPMLWPHLYDRVRDWFDNNHPYHLQALQHSEIIQAAEQKLMDYSSINRQLFREQQEIDELSAACLADSSEQGDDIVQTQNGLVPSLG